MADSETKGGASANVASSSASDKDAIDKNPALPKEVLQSKPITPFDIFERCIIRAENLISVHDSTESVDAISDAHYCDCYRAAVVLSISALDAFIRKVVISEIRNILSDSNEPLTPELGEYIKKLLNQDKLLEVARKSNLLDTVEKAVQGDFATKSFQGEWKITSFLKMVGYNNVFSEVSMRADVNEKKLIRKLNVFTGRRHVIAHSGDYDLNQTPHKENDIAKDYAKECIKTVRLFAANINEMVEEK